MVSAPHTNSGDTDQLLAERRAEARRLSSAKCELCVFRSREQRETINDAVTRNSSFRGLAVLAKLSGPVCTGRPVEAVLRMPDGGRRHFAGTVAFCRPVDGAYYQIGIDVKAVGSHEILAGDVKSSISLYDWFAEGLKAGDCNTV